MSDVIETTAAAAIAAPAAPAPAAPAAPAGAAPAAPAAAPEAAAPAAPAEPPAVKLPGKDATPEQWGEFFRSIGAPEKGDGYGLPVPEGGDPEFAGEAATMMAKAGLLPQQAQALAAWWNEKAAAITQQQAQAETQRLQALESKNRAEEAALRNEWGAEHANNVGLTKRAFEQFVKPVAGDKGPEVIAAVESVIGYAATMKLFHSLGKGLATGQARGLGGGDGGNQPKSLEERMYPSMR